MDQKAWLWKKKSSEKIIVASGKADLPLKGNIEEVQLPNEKEVALEKTVKILNERITSLLNECNAKEEELEKHAKTAKEAMPGQEKAEAEVLHLRKDLDDALQEKFAANERTSSLNAALKDCMQQLISIREEQEQKIHDAIMRTSKELSETNKKLANLTVENSRLGKVLIVKEDLIKELTNLNTQVETEFDTLMSRLDSVEKENAFLRYELRMAEKDLDIRNEETEISRRSTEASEKKQLESVKKIKRLEAECQRLRLLVRKRMPGFTPSALIKSEIEVQGRLNSETRRKKSNSRGGEEDLDVSNKRISFLVERLQNVEQENKILRDVLTDKDKESCYSSTQCTPMISKLSNVGTETDSNFSRRWASALISELENFKDGEFKTTPEHHMLGTSQMSLMDDFVEMEKLAIIAVDVPNTSSPSASVLHPVLPDSSEEDKCLNNMDSTGKELVPIGDNDLNDMNLEVQANDLSSPKHLDWLETILKVIIEQVHVSKRSIDELLEDIKIAFDSESQKARHSLHSREQELLPISGYITWKSPATSPGLNSPARVPDILPSEEEKNSESIESIGKIVELLRKFTCTSDSPVSPNQLTADSGFEIHSFGWKNVELSNVVQQFMQTCDLLLSGTIDFEKFAAELFSTLEWIMGKSIENKDSHALASELQQLREIIRSLEIELEGLRESKRVLEDQFENQKSINEDLDTQLTIETARLNEVSQKLSSVEVELEDRSHCCEELEGTCLELQLQLESVNSNEILKDNVNQKEELLQTGWEIKAASAKLAECEATILNLGNQLKALAKSNEASNTKKVLCNYKNSMKLNQRFSLLDRMLSEDDTGKEPVIHETSNQSAMHDSNAQLQNSEAKSAFSGALIVVPSKKRGGGIGFLRKLLLRKKRRSSHKTFLPFSP